LQPDRLKWGGFLWHISDASSGKTALYLKAVDRGRCSSTAEVVFKHFETGYQEILTDPSYARQMVTLTYPHIGILALNLWKMKESNKIWCDGLIIRDLPWSRAAWRSQESLDTYL